MSSTSLRREIIVWYSVVMVVTLSVFAGLSYLLLREALQRTGTASLRQTAQTAEQLIIPSGIPRLDVDEQMVTPRGGDVEALRRRTTLATGEVVDIYIARSGDVESRALRLFLLISLILIPLTTLAAAMGGRSLANRLLEPLNRLVVATREIGIGALSRRVEEPERPTELQELASSFNAMLDRLEKNVDTLRHFTADASHELRTPLTAIQGTIQVALVRERSADDLRETLEEVGEQAQWMLHLVEGLLTLARGEENSKSTYEAIDLVPLLKDVKEMGQALVGDKPVEVTLHAPADLHVRGAGNALRQVLLNLVSNAAKFTDSGSIAITAREAALPPGAATDRRWIEIEIADTGSGIAAEELPRVFDRFYRGTAARAEPTGSGLGLAIAVLVVEQHGGEVQVESTPGVGTTMRVFLPAN